MAKIDILKGDPKSGELELSDKGFSKVDKGGPVLWKIDKGSGVSEITGISIKDTPGSINIFSSGPEPDGGSTNWRGKVSAEAKTDAEYIYNIFWKDDAGGGPHRYDPILRVNP